MDNALIILLALLVYFAPTINANLKHKRNTTAIFLLNALLGWTVIGWIIAMVWSAVQDEPARR